MSVTANKVKMKYIHFSVVFALMFLFRFIPPFGTITPYGMTVIGIFIGLIYGWVSSPSASAILAMPAPP